MGSKAAAEGWNSSDRVLLSVLAAFAAILVILILRKRQKMSNKETLLENAMMSSVGLHQPHIIGLFILSILVVAVFVVLGFKNVTWTLLLIFIVALFGYLMKLTLESAVSEGETVIGPDGTILRKDSDETSVDSGPEHPNSGTYQLPTLA